MNHNAGFLPPAHFERSLRVLIAGALAASWVACGEGEPEPAVVARTQGADEMGITPASSFSEAANAAARAALPLDDQRDFEAAMRGRLASDPKLQITAPSGASVWEMEPYAFIEGDPPASLDESRVLHLENSVLQHRRRAPDPEADASIRVSKELLLGLVTGERGARDLVFGDELDIDGSRIDLASFFSLLQAPDENFSIVTP